MKYILSNPEFLKKLQVVAEKQSRPFEEIEKEASEYLKELYTEHKPLTQVIGYEMVQAIVSRGYEKKIDVNPNEMKKLSKLMRRHSVAFIMTHKTYIDTMILALTLVRYGMPLPYMFGGINMSFTGLKELGKQGGLIFIRRSFKDNEVYKLTLRHYISTIIEEGGHFNWAIEGTRSRTGKMVWPQMGILKYILEGEAESTKDVKYVPVSIVYDLIPDVKQMTLEGKGSDKKPESLAWFLNYIQKMGDNFGRAAIRFGDPVSLKNAQGAIIPGQERESNKIYNRLPLFAFELVHQTNQITPVTTVSLVCNALLSHFTLSKKEIESTVIRLMEFIERRKPDGLLDRSQAIGKSVQVALNLLLQAGIVKKTPSSLYAKYYIAENEYLRANYYSNMSASHFYRRAFIELALIKLAKDKSDNRLMNFWGEIMDLRDLFKFEFFYTNKAKFSDDVEDELETFDLDWMDVVQDKEGDIFGLLMQQNLSVSEAILLTHLEAYKVVFQTLIDWDNHLEYSKETFLDACLFKGREMHWQGRIRRNDSVSKPFLENGWRYADNKKLTPEYAPTKEVLKAQVEKLDEIIRRLGILQDLIIVPVDSRTIEVPLKREVVPGSNIENLSNELLEKEEGSHIAAFFDLDRTLINDFSAKQFFQSRLTSGQMTINEFLAQLAGIAVYATDNKNFASLASIGAQGVKGIREEDFINLGEDVYLEHLAETIYPEARALVATHMAKGHTVVVVSAATPYQVNPVARDLGIEHVMCTKLEVKNGLLTGNIEEPACWGEGKAIAGRTFSESHNIDLSKSYFYTDSAEDMPLLQIVGHPIAVNPDRKLSQVAFENNWTIHRFQQPGGTPLMNTVRTGLAIGSFYPAILNGVRAGTMNMSFQEGVNTAVATLGDLGTRLAGIEVAIKGKINLSYRPAVFLFNHQSSADLFIVSKVVRKDVRAIAKKELQYSPIGPLMKAAGVIFIDRSNRAKAIEAMKPAIEALQKGISIAIAPEGTRSKDRTLGKFKKGAFHLAMQADVPIIPIVIKNAHDALPKGSNLFKPSNIEVVILEPISVSDWDAKDLDAHVEMVRGLYLKELEQE